MERQATLLTSSVVALGFSFGLYEVLLPLYLDSLGVMLWDMGILFTVSSVAMAFLGFYVGSKSDVHGRKPFLCLALLLAGLSHLLLPLSSQIVLLVALKIVFDTSVVTKNAVFAPLLYERGNARFVTSYSRLIGLEFSSQAAGLLVGGIVADLVGYTYAFWISATAVVTMFFIFGAFYREDARAQPPLETRKSSEREGALQKELKVLALSGTILSFGGSLAHSFVMPLFFLKKFGLDASTVSVLMTLHRIGLGVPMLFADKAISRLTRAISEKRALMLLISVEGTSLCLTPLVGNLYLACFVWLLHDPLGASIWIPLRNSMIQEHCRDRTRGSDYSKVISLFQIGSVPASIFAGYAGSLEIGLPFLISGLVTVGSNILLLPL